MGRKEENRKGNFRKLHKYNELKGYSNTIESEIERLKKEITNTPVGFECWDCGDIVEDLDIEGMYYEVAPNSAEGNSMVICKICCENDDKE